MILPGQTIGILGGGQLGRMFAIAARRMGYRVHALDPTPDCPTGQVADLEITARYDDADAANSFAEGVDVVTFEFENVPSETLKLIADRRPVYPSPFVLETTRHRLKEKQFLTEIGVPVADFRAVDSPNSLRAAVEELGSGSVLKTAEFGYDGHGQTRINTPDAADAAWESLNCPLGVLEQFVPFDREISVVIARGAGGQTVHYPPFENKHERHILDLTVWPAIIDEALSVRAVELAEQIAIALDLRGVMCVEMFVIGSSLIVNELAPRPHNSGHLTIDAFNVDQFQLQLRAVCSLPMIMPQPQVKAATMANLLGDLWPADKISPPWNLALTDPAVRLHLYGKSEPKPGRKMGHLTATAETVEQAAEKVLAARAALSTRTAVE